FKIPPEKMVKTIIYNAGGKLIAACVDGASDINESKLRKVFHAKEMRLATPEEIKKATGASIGFSGPVGLSVPLIVDSDVIRLKNMVTGANQNDKHYKNVNFGRDFQSEEIHDLRYVKEGDRCPVCESRYDIQTAMEMGHTFQLGTR